MGSEQYNGMDVDRFEGTMPADMTVGCNGNFRSKRSDRADLD